MVVIPIVVNLFGGAFDPPVIIVPIFLLFFGWTMFRTIRRERALMKSYTLEITDTGINRRLKDIRYVSISSTTITEIIQFKKGGFLVKGRGGEQIMIPRGLDDTGKLEEQLRALAPITVEDKDPLNLKHRWFMLLSTAALYLCVSIISNKTVVAVAAILAVGLTGFAVFQIRTNKNIYAASKRGSWLYFFILGITLFLALIKLIPQW